MNKIILSLSAILMSAWSYAGGDKYQFSIDLTKVSSDMVEVSLNTPTIKSEKIVYNIPKIVPGTYSIYDFGQYAMEFEAFDDQGAPLGVTRLDDNRWEIADATKLAKVKYWVEDTWDATVQPMVFEPGGTNIEKDENIVLNNHGFFGYFDGLKNLKYELNVTRPSDFYGATGLSDIVTNGNVDTYTIANYMDLVDSPIMYNRPDTTTLKVGNTDVLVSVYTKNGKVSSKEIAENISDILNAQKNYLGGTLPVDKYAFIIYLYAGQSGSGGSGALEHSYSSFYYLPELSAERISGIIVDVAAHEFFHIVTPLNIHSEEIGDFDFIEPKMSKHLWMYEGVTEYFAGHVQVYEDMITPEEYLNTISGKITGSGYYKDDLAFTEMSLGCLDEYENQYGNVYQKGALIGLCLDILLREQSKGEMGMKDMMAALAKEYGKDKSFKDEELFDKITSLSSPEIRKFFKTYVEGPDALPIKDLLGKVGINYDTDVKIKEFSLGRISLGFNPETKRMLIADVSNMNAFGEKMGYKANDEIISINGVEVTPENARSVVDDYKNNTKEGDKVQVVVARNVKGKSKEVTLKAKAFKVESNKKFIIEFNPEATKEQISLRNAWLGKS